MSMEEMVTMGVVFCIVAGLSYFLWRIFHPPLEIERKYLVRNFSSEMLPPDAIMTDIVQDYLVSKSGETRRLRKAATNGKTVYFYTEKAPTRKRGTCVEREREISEEEYRRLLAEKDPALATICKTRYSFWYEGHVLEVDVFTSGRPAEMGLVLLEIELDDIDEFADIPFGWDVEDVTDDPQYKNRALAAL